MSSVSPNSPSEQMRPKVLVVDDERENLELMARALRSGFTVVTATSADEAVKLARETHHFIAVLCDQRLPDQKGSALLEKLAEYLPDTERILISGSATYEDLVEAINCGAVHRYLEKPISADELRTVVNNAFRRSQSQAPAGTRPSLLPTGLGEEKAATFDADLEREIDRASERKEVFTLVLLEVAGGHPASEVASRTASVLDGTDGGGGPRRTDVVSLLGEGAYAVFLQGTEKAQALSVAMRIAASLRTSIKRAEGQRDVGVSIGLAEFPRDGSTSGQLMDAATRIIDLARSCAGDLTIAYDEHVVRSTRQGSLRQWANRVEAVESVITDRCFSLLYQPIVHMEGNEIVAYEALCRPECSEFAGPTELFRVASSIGAVGRLGQAIRMQLGTEAAGLPVERSLFLNLHPDELLDSRLVESLHELSGLGARLVLEVTEVAELREIASVIGVLAELRESGVRVAVDDFGAGHSGVSRILHLHPDFLKLDATLMRMIGTGEKTDRFIRFLLKFCFEEEIDVIAEGIESIDEKHRLIDMGISLGQGYLFGRPAAGFAEAREIGDGPKLASGS